MPMPIQLRVRSAAAGWTIEVGHRDTRPTTAQVDSASIEALAQTCATLLRGSTSPVMVPGRDSKRSRAEQQAGAALGAWVQQEPAIATALAGLLGQARASREGAVLVVDAPEAPARQLPWELICLSEDTPCLEATGDLVVARMLQGHARQSIVPKAHVPVLLWSPEPDDTVVSALAGQVRETCRTSGIGAPRPFDPAEAPSAQGAPAILHVVCHGRRVGEQIALLTGADASTAAHSLSPWLRDCLLVVLDVCESGDATTGELDTLAGQLIAAGAPAVVAPNTRTSAQAAHAFHMGLYAALGAGMPISEAVSAGRRRVRSLAHPHPDSRWNNTLLYVGDLATAAAGPVLHTHWRPEGWPTASPDAAEFLELTRKLATPWGFVGIEHLVEALLEVPTGGKICQQVRYHLQQGPRALSRVKKLRFSPDRSVNFHGTPRLQQLKLAAGFTLDELFGTLWDDPTRPLHTIAEVPALQTMMDPGGETLEPDLVLFDSADASPAEGLRVLGGPQDGLVLPVEPGSVIGRARSQGEGLYANTVLVDPFLSRSALTWVRSGLVRLKKEGRIWRGDRWETLPAGEHPLLAGEVVALTPATRVQGY